LRTEKKKLLGKRGTRKNTLHSTVPMGEKNGRGVDDYQRR